MCVRVCVFLLSCISPPLLPLFLSGPARRTPAKTKLAARRRDAGARLARFPCAASSTQSPRQHRSSREPSRWRREPSLIVAAQTGRLRHQGSRRDAAPRRSAARRGAQQHEHTPSAARTKHTPPGAPEWAARSSGRRAHVRRDARGMACCSHPQRIVRVAIDPSKTWVDKSGACVSSR